MIPFWLLTFAYYLSFSAGVLVLALIGWHYWPLITFHRRKRNGDR